VNPLPNVSAGPDQNVCEGNQITLNGSGAITYQWDNGVVNGVPFTQAVQQMTYTVIGTDANGCQNQDQVVVTMLSNPTPSFTISDTWSCYSPFEVFFQNTTSGSTALCYWNFGNGQTSSNCDGGIALYTDEGCYNVSLNVTYTNGCTNSLVNYNAICVSSPPTAAFVANPTTTDVGMPINFINYSEGAVSYIWNFGDYSATTTDTHPVYSYNDGGNFVVTLVAINDFGCTDTAYQMVLIKNPLLFYVPNTFTPDNDSHNNEFIPIMTSGYDPWDYELIIFNRWGEIIFVSRHPKKGWDGTYGGKECQDGTYIWQINVRNADGQMELHRGHVNLLR
jgi:gliding motility-associated-like protein